MPVQNLEQKRAFNALEKSFSCRKREGEGDCLSGFPSLIINNGLIACLAYSIEKSAKKDGSLDNQKQWINISNAIAFHLHEMGIASEPHGHADTLWLRDYLAGQARNAQNQTIAADSFTLRRATDEALVFLSYLKRFVKTASQVP